jgi:putative transport protein
VNHFPNPSIPAKIVMNWLFDLYRTNPTAQAIAVISLVCMVGMSLGSIKIRGVKLGTAGVLFAAIVAGHFSQPVNHPTLEFVKELGLILFVFCIGLQIGPGFFASLRRAGLRFNAIALVIVLVGSITAVLLGWVLGFDEPAVLGLLAGATTNTPSLGAAQQTLATMSTVSADRAALPALAYAVSYPLGIVGTIGSLLALKSLFRINIEQEVAMHAAETGSKVEPLQRRTLVVENPNLHGLTIRDIPGMKESAVVVSRVRLANQSEVTAATSATELHSGDHILAVGSTRGLDQVQCVVGRSSDVDLMTESGTVTFRRVVVTNTDVLGKSIGELDLEMAHGVVTTRITRGGLEMTVGPLLQLVFGDVLTVVGPDLAIQRAADLLGDSEEALNETHFVPLFAGISLGIALGTLPLAVPGLPQPLRLGLAAGPLIIAILVGRRGRIGRLVWHMPRNANIAFREFGIALFFAGIGLMAGPTFFSAAFSATGALWLVTGVCVTVAPLLLIGIFARKVLGLNFVDLSGLLAGSMTDPPALAFANGICQSEAPALAYATVYPLTMLLRIIVAQFLVIALCG